MRVRQWVVFWALCVAVGVSAGWLSVHLEVVAIACILAAVLSLRIHGSKAGA